MKLHNDFAMLEYGRKMSKSEKGYFEEERKRFDEWMHFLSSS